MQVLQLLRENSHELRPLLVAPLIQPRITSNLILDLFQPQLAPVGNHRREVEEEVLFKWCNFIQGIQGQSPVLSLVALG